jgi:hypothetical protein
MRGIGGIRHVLGEKPVKGLVSLSDIRPASNNVASPANRHREEKGLLAD